MSIIDADKPKSCAQEVEPLRKDREHLTLSMSKSSENKQGKASLVHSSCSFNSSLNGCWYKANPSLSLKAGPLTMPSAAFAATKNSSQSLGSKPESDFEGARST